MRALFPAIDGLREVVKTSWGSVVIKSASLRQILEIARANPDGGLAGLGLGGRRGAHTNRAAVALLMASVEKPGRLRFWWILYRATPQQREALAEAAGRLTWPTDEMDAFFRPHDDKGGDKASKPLTRGYVDHRNEPLAMLVSMAIELEIRGHRDPFGLSPAQLTWRARHIGDNRRTDLLHDATASRAAQADEKSWKVFVRDETR